MVSLLNLELGAHCFMACRWAPQQQWSCSSAAHRNIKASDFWDTLHEGVFPLSRMAMKPLPCEGTRADIPANEDVRPAEVEGSGFEPLPLWAVSSKKF